MTRGTRTLTRRDPVRLTGVRRGTARSPGAAAPPRPPQPPAPAGKHNSKRDPGPGASRSHREAPLALRRAEARHARAAGQRPAGPGEERDSAAGPGAAESQAREKGSGATRGTGEARRSPKGGGRGRERRQAEQAGSGGRRGAMQGPARPPARPPARRAPGTHIASGAPDTKPWETQRRGGGDRRDGEARALGPAPPRELRGRWARRTGPATGGRAGAGRAALAAPAAGETREKTRAASASLTAPARRSGCALRAGPRLKAANRPARHRPRPAQARRTRRRRPQPGQARPGPAPPAARGAFSRPARGRAGGRLERHMEDGGGKPGGRGKRNRRRPGRRSWRCARLPLMAAGAGLAFL